MKNIGDYCEICHETIWAGEAYLSNWGDNNGSVHVTCNDKRLGLDKSHFSPTIHDIQSAASAMGKKGGSSRSAKKNISSRENGKKGGRPKKN